MLLHLAKLSPLQLLHLLLDGLRLEGQEHLLVGLRVEPCLVLLSLNLVVGALFEAV